MLTLFSIKELLRHRNKGWPEDVSVHLWQRIPKQKLTSSTISLSICRVPSPHHLAIMTLPFPRCLKKQIACALEMWMHIVTHREHKYSAAISTPCPTHAVSKFAVFCAAPVTSVKQKSCKFGWMAFKMSFSRAQQRVLNPHDKRHMLICTKLNIKIYLEAQFI